MNRRGVLYTGRSEKRRNLREHLLKVRAAPDQTATVEIVALVHHAELSIEIGDMRWRKEYDSSNDT